MLLLTCMLQEARDEVAVCRAQLVALREHLLLRLSNDARQAAATTSGERVRKTIYSSTIVVFEIFFYTD
jgi:hypothetical protein